MLKASSKKINPTKKRAKIPLLGSIKDFKAASKVKKESTGKTNQLDFENYGEKG